MGCLHSSNKDSLANIEKAKLLSDQNLSGKGKGTQKLTSSRHAYNKKERFLNWCVGVLVGMDIEFVSLDPESVMNAACYRTGCDDFGSTEFVPRLTKLLQCGHDGGITSLARLLFREALVGKCATRLKMQAYISAHPEVLHIPINKPVFIVGLPRTGTTFLQNILALQGGMRPLKFWELTTPTPVSEDNNEDITTRRNHAARLLRLAYFLSPEMADVHELTADTPEECWHLFATTFAILNMDLSSGLKEFGNWLVNQDLDQSYLEFRRSLQVMANQAPTENFCLKCPEHLWFLDSLIKAFPDASIIWTHRDPLDSIASYCSLVSLSRRTFYGEFDPIELGEHIQERFHDGISRAMKVVESKEYAGRIHHVKFEDLVSDPCGAVRAICGKFGYNCSEDLELLVDNYLNNERKDKKGSHKYSADLYGLDRAVIHEQYADYINAYDVNIKGKRSRNPSKTQERREHGHKEREML